MKIRNRFYRRYLGAGTAGSTERRVELLAIALAVLLLVQWLLGGISLAMLAEPEAIRPELGGEDDRQPVGLERVSAAQRDEISARPLFWVSRRPEVPASGAGETDNPGSRAGRLNEVTILGVFGSGGMAGVIALVDERETRVLLGETLQGWELEAVHPDRVELTRSGRRETLFLTPGDNRVARAKPVSRPPKRAGLRGRSAAATRPARVNDNDKRGAASARQLGWGGVADETGQ